MRKGLLAFFAVMFFTSESFATCAGVMFNPITDIDFRGFTPIEWGETTILPEDDGAGINWANNGGNPAFCVCPVVGVPFPVPGIPISLFIPFKGSESVKDAFCFPTLGISIPNVIGAGALNGNNNAQMTSTGNSQLTTMQTHQITIPVASIMTTLLAGSCVNMALLDTSFLIGSISELDITHQNDEIALFTAPEGFLYGNLVYEIACMVETPLIITGHGLPWLNGCSGSWCRPYPLTKSCADSDLVQSELAISWRTFYKSGRPPWGIAIIDVASDPAYCAPVPLPVPVKNNYKMQFSKPTLGYMINSIGRPTLISGVGMNSPLSGTNDNFLNIIWRRLKCCAW